MTARRPTDAYTIRRRAELAERRRKPAGREPMAVQYARKLLHILRGLPAMSRPAHAWTLAEDIALCEQVIERGVICHKTEHASYRRFRLLVIEWGVRDMRRKRK